MSIMGRIQRYQVKRTLAGAQRQRDKRQAVETGMRRERENIAALKRKAEYQRLRRQTQKITHRTGGTGFFASIQKGARDMQSGAQSIEKYGLFGAPPKKKKVMVKKRKKSKK